MSYKNTYPPIRVADSVQIGPRILSALDRVVAEIVLLRGRPRNIKVVCSKRENLVGTLISKIMNRLSTIIFLATSSVSVK